MILWQGHEVEAYKISSATNNENGTAADPLFARTGMRVGRSGAGDLYSTPNWAATNEIWHRFRHNDHTSTNQILWAAVNAAGVKVAQIIALGFTGPLQYQALVGGVMTNVGASWAAQANGITTRFDIHHLGGAAGRVEVYYGTEGAQTKVVDQSLDLSTSVAIVGIYHGTNTTGGGFDTNVSEEVVQTIPTLSTRSEIKPPIAQGADVDGTGNYTAVDELSYSDADFIALSAAGQRQSFKATARAETQNTVSGITASCRAWYETGGPTRIKPYLTIGGVRYYGTIFTLDLVALGYQYTWQSNPATGVAFTTAEANDAALEWGWEAVA